MWKRLCFFCVYKKMWNRTKINGVWVSLAFDILLKNSVPLQGQYILTIHNLNHLCLICISDARRHCWCRGISDSSGIVTEELILYQQCLRHRWYDISSVRDTDNFDGNFRSRISAVPLMPNRRCFRHRWCFNSGISDTARFMFFFNISVNSKLNS
jgi:hypothetical protein